MVGHMVADFQQHGNGKLAHGRCAICRNIADRDIFFSGVDIVHDIVTRCQHANKAHIGASVDDMAGNGSLIGIDCLRIPNAGNDFRLIGQRGTVIHRQFSQRLQGAPAKISGILRVPIQNYDFHLQVLLLHAGVNTYALRC